MAPNQENIEARLCAYVDDELTDQERIEIEAHLAANPHHRRLLRELAQTRTLLRSLPRAKSPHDLVEGFQSQLERNALLDDEPTDESGAVLRINRRPQLYAAAAMLLLAAGLAVLMYEILPSSKPAREVVMVPPTTPPGLATTDDGLTGATLPDSPTTTSSPHAPQPGNEAERVAPDAGKALASTAAPVGGGRGAGTMGTSEFGGGDGHFSGKAAPLPTGKMPAGKPSAGPEEVLSLQRELSKRDNSSTLADATKVTAGTLTIDGITNNNSSVTSGNLDVPVVVVVNANDPNLANGDVSGYLRENKIAYVADADNNATAADESNYKLTPASPAPAPADPGAGEGASKKDFAKAPDGPEPKKPDWYVDSSNQMHYGLPPAKDAKASALAAARPAANEGVLSPAAGPNTDNAARVTTRPINGAAFANSYNLTGNFGNTTSNAVTYRAVMSHRQVIDLNARLMQREGQLATEVRSDAFVNRPEGNALVDNMRLNNVGAYTINGGNMAPSSLTSNATAPTVLDKAGVGGQQLVSSAAKGKVAQADRPEEVVADPKEAGRRAPINQSKMAAAPTARPPDDLDQTVQRARAAPIDGGGGGAGGEKNAQSLDTRAAQNWPATQTQADTSPVERQSASAMQQQMKQQAPPRAIDSPSQQAQSESPAPSAPARGVNAEGGQQVLPPPAASAAGSQAASQGARVQSAPGVAMQQQAIQEDDQPHAVLIVVTGQTPAATATPPAVQPTTQPATPTTRPAPAEQPLQESK